MPAAFQALAKLRVSNMDGGPTDSNSPRTPTQSRHTQFGSPTSLRHAKSSPTMTTRNNEFADPLTLPPRPSYGRMVSRERVESIAKSSMSFDGVEDGNPEETSSLENRRMSGSIVRSSIEMGLNAPNTNSDRDRYGFKKKSNFVAQDEYDKWWDMYRAYAQRRKQKWVRLMKENGVYLEDDQPVRFPPKSEKVKRYIRKGIPAEWRGNAWFWYAKGHDILNSHPDLYDKLCRQTKNLRNNDTELIERDLHRTFPDNIHFRAEGQERSAHHQREETPLIQALRHVLTAFSVYQPKIGYCQSLNFIAGILLLFMDEERAFWMLVIITQRYLPGVHEVNLEGVNVDQGVLMLCVRESLPNLWDKLGVNFEGKHYDNILTKLPPITLCTASWFMSAYISILPTETMLRVWDCFFFEDSKIFFRIALTILKLAEPELHGLGDQMEIFQVIQNFPKRLLDPSLLMENCFKRRNGFGHISQAEILRLRQFVAERRRFVNSAMQKKDGSTHSLQQTSTTDLDEFSKLKPASKGLHLSRRMRSLKINGSNHDKNKGKHIASLAKRSVNFL
jgi:hypothetical protein